MPAPADPRPARAEAPTGPSLPGARPSRAALPSLAALVRGDEWLMGVLAAVRSAGLPDAWVAAGTLRDLVWGSLYGDGFRPEDVRDVDVVYFDPSSSSRADDDRATAALTALRPEVPWEARNQAIVHTWYHARFGGPPVPPLTSIADAAGTFPETATAVAVRLTCTGEIRVCAPFGLDDLLGGVWRRNPRRVSREISRARLARHRPAERWPGVTIVPL